MNHLTKDQIINEENRSPAAWAWLVSCRELIVETLAGKRSFPFLVQCMDEELWLLVRWNDMDIDLALSRHQTIFGGKINLGLEMRRVRDADLQRKLAPIEKQFCSDAITRIDEVIAGQKPLLELLDMLRKDFGLIKDCNYSLHCALQQDITLRIFCGKPRY